MYELIKRRFKLAVKPYGQAVLVAQHQLTRIICTSAELISFTLVQVRQVMLSKTFRRVLHFYGREGWVKVPEYKTLHLSRGLYERWMEFVRERVEVADKRFVNHVMRKALEFVLERGDEFWAWLREKNSK